MLVMATLFQKLATGTKLYKLNKMVFVTIKGTYYKLLL